MLRRWFLILLLLSMSLFPGAAALGEDEPAGARSPPSCRLYEFGTEWSDLQVYYQCALRIAESIIYGENGG